MYNGTNISAAAVAAHESGHAVQHAAACGPLMFRSKMVPAVQVSSTLVNWILLAGIIVLATTKSPVVLLPDRHNCDEYYWFIYTYHPPC